MSLRVGVDIVEHQRFHKQLENSALMARIFSPLELEDDRLEHLAGFFAAKEAIVKALGIAAGSWLSIRMGNDKFGKPTVEFLPPLIKPKDFDLSISHDGNYTVAFFVAKD